MSLPSIVLANLAAIVQNTPSTIKIVVEHHALEQMLELAGEDGNFLEFATWHRPRLLAPEHRGVGAEIVTLGRHTWENRL